MKTTLELPNELFREAKATAARKGLPLRQLVTEAIQEKLNRERSDQKPWMKHFGSLAHLHAENQRIEKLITEEFSAIDPEDWQ